MKRYTLLLVLIFSFATYYTQNDFSYLCPLPDSKYINPEQVILIKSKSAFNPDLSYNNLISITGTIAGKYNFNTKLLDDDKLLSIVPQKKFKYGEKITISIYNINNNQPLEFDFYIKEHDNLPLLKEYYKSQLHDPQIINLKNNITNNVKSTPANYPDPLVQIYQETTDKNYFLTVSPRAGASGYDNYLSINDNYGTPIFFRETDYNTLNFHVLQNGQLTYASNRYGNPELESYYFMDSSYVVTDSIKTVVGYNMDGHDMLLLDNGHYMLISYDPQIVNMSNIVPGGNPNATVTGLVIQEVDINGNLYFQWRSWDHFEITDATSDISLTAAQIDYVHGNAIEIDTDGNLLLSSRHLDEITKINLESGDVIYRMGLLAKNNEFTFVNDARGFSHQHDVRLLPNGNITIYDNGNLHPNQYSRAIEYNINEATKVATLVWSYQNNPVIYGSATGSYRRDFNGNHLIGWGPTWPVGGSELKSDNSIAAEIEFPDGVYTYRIIKDNWETNLFTSLKQLDFGNYYDGPEYKMQVFPIANNGEQIIRITSTHLHNSEFVILDPLPIVIQPNDTVTVIAGFKPSENNTYTDRLTLNYDRITLTEKERIARQLEMKGIWNPNKPVISYTPSFDEINVSPDIEIVVNFSEPMRKFGGGTITSSDIQSIFRFKYENQWGANVSFTGEINDEATEIIIYPDEILDENQSYYVELKSSMLQSEAGTLVNYPEATYFTTGTLVEVETTSRQSFIEIYPNPARDYFIVNVMNNSHYNITITTQDGKVVYNSSRYTSKTIINSSDFAKGVYFVCISTPNEENIIKKIIKL